MSGALNILRIEIDGHFHGGEPVKPWVAEIKGLCPKFGLAREFVQPMNDWSQASRAMSGNIYGRVATFALRNGNLYEVQRCRGNSSKRRVVREFVAVSDGKREVIDPEEALARVDGGGDALVHRVPDDKSADSWIARIERLGMPSKCGFATAGTERIYRLRDGLYECAREGQSPSLTMVEKQRASRITQREALEWLLARSR